MIAVVVDSDFRTGRACRRLPLFLILSVIAAIVVTGGLARAGGLAAVNMAPFTLAHAPPAMRGGRLLAAGDSDLGLVGRSRVISPHPRPRTRRSSLTVKPAGT